jgi:hypothetical protein
MVLHTHYDYAFYRCPDCNLEEPLGKIQKVVDEFDKHGNLLLSRKYALRIISVCRSYIRHAHSDWVENRGFWFGKSGEYSLLSQERFGDQITKYYKKSHGRVPFPFEFHDQVNNRISGLQIKIAIKRND